MATMSTVIVLHLLVFTGEESVVSAVPVETTFSYDPADDPWAVLVAFDVHPDEAVKWRLDRGVLAAGLNADSGDGDVRAWPASERDLVIRLSNPDSTGMLRAPADEVGTFLECTYRLVPDGAEPGYLDIDTALRDFLDGDQPR